MKDVDPKFFIPNTKFTMFLFIIIIASQSLLFQFHVVEPLNVIQMSYQCPSIDESNIIFVQPYLLIVAGDTARTRLWGLDGSLGNPNQLTTVTTFQEINSFWNKNGVEPVSDFETCMRLYELHQAAVRNSRLSGGYTAMFYRVRNVYIIAYRPSQNGRSPKRTPHPPALIVDSSFTVVSEIRF